MGEPRVKAVLFDSGGVLIGPVGGRWNPRFDFESIVERHAPHVSAADLAHAAEVGEAFLDESDGTPSRDDYHRAMLETLGVPATDELLAELDAPMDPADVVEPYPEVIEVLDALRDRRVPMAVVSDAWPELPHLHAGVGIGDYFDVYAISAVLGCTKPDPRMYRHASDGLGLTPPECLFVDDYVPHVEAALALGYQAYAVLRDGATATTVPFITDLRELLVLVA